MRMAINIINIFIIAICYITVTEYCVLELGNNLLYYLILLILTLLYVILFIIIYNREDKKIQEIGTIILTIIITFGCILSILLVLKLYLSEKSEIYINEILQLKIIKTEWKKTELLWLCEKYIKENNINLYNTNLFELINEIKTPEDIKIKINKIITENKNKESWSNFNLDSILSCISQNKNILLISFGVITGGTVVALFGWTYFFSGLFLLKPENSIYVKPEYADHLKIGIVNLQDIVIENQLIMKKICHVSTKLFSEHITLIAKITDQCSKQHLNMRPVLQLLAEYEKGHLAEKMASHMKMVAEIGSSLIL